MENRLQQFESKMETTRFLWLFNIFLALIILANAEVGHLLGVQGLPFSVSVVWASTGFSLAAILLLGYRMWPGILLGNLIYNFIHLYIAGLTVFEPFLTALVISLGSLLQAFVGGFIMRKYTSVGYFSTVKDVVIFLIPAGILTCTISCSIGVLALYAYGILTPQTIGSTWVHFWLGDSMGVYIFTPLLVIWTLHRTVVAINNYVWEALVMFAVFIFMSWIVFIYDYPLVHFFIPLSMWISYRFRMYGATLFVFLTTLVSLMATTQGYGTFVRHFVCDPLPILVSYLEVIVSTSLVLAACANDSERQLLAQTTDKSAV